jgi:hypothetical protein
MFYFPIFHGIKIITYVLFEINDDNSHNIIITITTVYKDMFVHAYTHIKLNMFMFILQVAFSQTIMHCKLN